MWIRPFRAGGEFYIYSGWSNEIRRVGARTYRFFVDPAHGPTSEEARQAAASLGLLPERPPAVELFTPAAVGEALALLRRQGPARLVMTVTEACNFRCRYCVYSGAYPHARRHGNLRMPLATALAALEWYLSFPRDEYLIGFYGGEPLLELGLVRRVVHEARRKVRAGARLSFAMTTNGWLLDAAAVRFLAENEFDLFVSLDGPAGVHDRYRRTAGGRATFARVWERVGLIRRLDARYFSRHVNFCMMAAPPDRLDETLGFVERNEAVFGGKTPVLLTLERPPRRLLSALGVKPGAQSVHLGPLQERYVSRLAAGREPDALSRAAAESALAAIGRRSMTSPSVLTISGGQCVPGTRCHVTPDGTLHMCERADSSFPIGHVRTGYDERAIAALLGRYARMVRAHCRDCWAIRLCRKCTVDIARGGRLSHRRLAEVCAERRARLARDLADYCRIMASGHAVPGAAAHAARGDAAEAVWPGAVFPRKTGGRHVE